MEKVERCDQERYPKAAEIDRNTWYNKAMNRWEWLKICRKGVIKYIQTQYQLLKEPNKVECIVCSKQFRESVHGKAHHKCSHEKRPLKEQEGPVGCDVYVYGRWFRNRGA